jgi:hypothetical protein
MGLLRFLPIRNPLIKPPKLAKVTFFIMSPYEYVPVRFPSGVSMLSTMPRPSDQAKRVNNRKWAWTLSRHPAIIASRMHLVPRGE